jgi:hypothetical protein
MTINGSMELRSEGGRNIKPCAAASLSSFGIEILQARTPATDRHARRACLQIAIAAPQHSTKWRSSEEPGHQLSHPPSRDAAIIRAYSVVAGRLPALRVPLHGVASPR